MSTANKTIKRLTYNVTVTFYDTMSSNRCHNNNSDLLLREHATLSIINIDT